MKRINKIYGWVLLCMAAVIVVLTVFAGYTVGVVNKNSVIVQIDENIGSAESYLKINQDAAELLMEEFEDDYAAKTRTVAMLLSKETSYLSDDQTLEELRVAVNADHISVSDDEGNITASTDLSSEGTSICDEFQSNLTEEVYTEVLFLLESDTPTIVAASSLDGGDGIVQITFPASNVISLLEEVDLSQMASDLPLYTSGITAVLDADTMTYISCTDTSKVGEQISYDTSLFEKNKGRFDVEDFDREEAMLCYQTIGDYLILAIVPYSDIYYTRNVVMGWIAIGGALLLISTGLSLRMAQIALSRKSNEK